MGGHDANVGRAAVRGLLIALASAVVLQVLVLVVPTLPGWPLHAASLLCLGAGFGFALSVVSARTAALRARDLAIEEGAVSSRTFRQITSGLREVLWIVDLPSKSFVYVSEAGADVFGFDFETPVPARRFIDAVLPEDLATFEYALRDPLQLEASWRRQFRIRRPDGEIRWLEVRLSSADGGPDASPTRIVGITEDITDRRAQEAQLAAQTDRIHHAQKMEAIGRLAGGIAHDFNNLLTVIRLNAELLGDEGLGGVESPELVQIEEAAGRAAQLTQQLLAYSRQQLLKIDVFDLDEEVEQLGPRLARLVGAEVAFDVERAGALPLVRADRSQVEQVLTQLVVNAAEALEGQGGRIALRTLPAAESDGLVAFEIEDNGVGMSESVLAHAFEPFFTTKEVGEGSGLGLSTVQGIVTQMGGEVEVFSALGEGTRVQVRLPRASTRPRLAESQAPSGETDAPQFARVLVVEDEPAVLRLVKRVIRKMGCKVVTASEGEEALRRFEEEGPFDLVLTDIQMPGMDGVELARRITARDSGAEVVLMSGFAVRTQDLVTEDYELVPKPFTADQLREVIGRVLAASRAGERHRQARVPT